MFTGWAWMLTWVVLPALVATIVVIVLARGRRGARPGALTRAEEWVVALVGTGSLMVAAASAFFLVAGAAQTFGSEPTRVAGFPLANAETPPFASRSDLVSDAGYESAWVEVTDLPAAPRWWLYAELALPVLAALTIGIAVAWLAIALLRGRPFLRSLPNVVGVTAIAVMVGGVGSQIAAAIARGATVEYLDPRVITAGDAGDGAYEGLMALSLGLNLAPIGWALGLALVAAAFQIGTRLQRDTEGLV